MSSQNVDVRIVIRNDTSDNWETINPILLKGELIYISDLKRFKIGNGIDNYSILDFLPSFWG